MLGQQSNVYKLGKQALRKLVGPLTVGLLALATAIPGHAETIAQKGRKLAEANCSRCHIVGDDNKFGGISSTPSFRLIVQALDDWRERFQTFHTRLPHPSVIRIEGSATPFAEPTTEPIYLKIEDVDALVAFAETFVKK